jgi:hypothetical protein
VSAGPWLWVLACNGVGDPPTPADRPSRAPTATADTANIADPGGGSGAETGDSPATWTEATLLYTPDWDGVRAFSAAWCDDCHDAGKIAPWSLIGTLERQLVDGIYDGPVLVVPGDPGASLLWRSLYGDEGTVLMPWNIPEPLPPEVRNHVWLWIADGAVIEATGLP